MTRILSISQFMVHLLVLRTLRWGFQSVLLLNTLVAAALVFMSSSTFATAQKRSKRSFFTWLLRSRRSAGGLVISLRRLGSRWQSFTVPSPNPSIHRTLRDEAAQRL
jgi:hypothetical protein